jgi:hypothetical protein
LGLRAQRGRARSGELDPGDVARIGGHVRPFRTRQRRNEIARLQHQFGVLHDGVAVTHEPHDVGEDCRAAGLAAPGFVLEIVAHHVARFPVPQPASSAVRF